MLKNNYWLALSSIILGLAVLLGAFGAHGLKAYLPPKSLETFNVGVHYQFIHGLALLSVNNLAQKLDIKMVNYLFLLGIVLFCGNCYLYSITQIKAFAMVVPLGGLSYVAAWFLLTYRLIKG